MTDFRTIAIPNCRAPRHLIHAREAKLVREGKGYDYPCVVCGLPIAEPKQFVHLVGGGGELLHVDDEAKWVAEYNHNHPEDLYFYPIGPECARKHKQLKPYIHKEK